MLRHLSFAPQLLPKLVLGFLPGRRRKRLRAEMVKETGHSRRASSLAEDFGKRLDMRDHKIEKKAAKKRELRVLMRDVDAMGARLKGDLIWDKAKDGELTPDDYAQITPAVRAHIEVLRMEDVADVADLLQKWVEKEKKITEYLLSPAAAELTADARGGCEITRSYREKTVRELKDEMTQLLLLLRP